MARAIKLDTQLAEAVREAHEALIPLVPAGSVGEHLGATADADRLVTHRFEASVTGYRGWEWYVTLGRASRSKVVTVCESGLLPGPDALLSPDWVPWSERMSAAELASARGEATPDDAAAEPGENVAEAAAGETDDTAASAAEDAQQDEPAAGAAEPEDDASDGADDAASDDEASDEEADGAPAARAPRRRRRRRRS
ncbi:DUF3027 domain-containing protein [Galactobacter valiniphilus]|uniref:DUF3027 domain-containing protein n=1 Tax=Galactobacter valiniphilus TaxID=2676122 RepID=A0A399JCU3_9MICC|nr:DUF3027 domain-containing protein [Galactobacter valiniphilus]RII42377.1 DUF3027 domain-containing protein [Galactobacter valiniphilus]